MRISRILCALIVMLSTAGFSFAAQTGGLAAPLNPGAGTLSVGVTYAQQDVKDDDYDDQAQLRRMLFKGQFGVGRGVDFYAMLGLSDLGYREADFNGSLGEAIGLGIRFSPIRPNKFTSLVFDLQGEYMASEDSNDKVKRQAYHLASYLVGDMGAGGVSGYFYPYGGVRLSLAEYDNKGAEDFRNRYMFGVMGGADYFVNPNVFFNVEVHLFDEESLTFGVGYRIN